MREPLFVFCPGRSFSSVMCAIIGQHPECYGLPEINLFIGDTIGEAREAFKSTGRNGFPGLDRTIAQLHYGEQSKETVEKAQAWAEDNRDMTPQECLDHIRSCVGDRIIVEKSPANVRNAESVNQILKAYPDAWYMQLLRHPRSRGTSQRKALEENKMRALFNEMAGAMVDYEAKWTETHIMLHGLMDQLPPGQMLRAVGEVVLQNLPLYLPQICEWLDISTDPKAIEAMLHPEDSPFSNLGPENATGGANRGFLENPHLDLEKLSTLTAPTLDAPMDWAPDRSFSDVTKELAAFYGYR